MLAPRPLPARLPLERRAALRAPVGDGGAVVSDTRTLLALWRDETQPAGLRAQAEAMLTGAAAFDARQRGIDAAAAECQSCATVREWSAGALRYCGDHAVAAWRIHDEQAVARGGCDCGALCCAWRATS